MIQQSYTEPDVVRINAVHVKLFIPVDLVSLEGAFIVINAFTLFELHLILPEKYITSYKANYVKVSDSGQSR